MSVDKVNRNRSERETRKSEIAKEKREQLIAKLVVIIVGIALIVWIGFSVYDKINSKTEGTDGTNVNVSALDDYLNGFEQIEADPGE